MFVCHHSRKEKDQVLLRRQNRKFPIDWLIKLTAAKGYRKIGHATKIKVALKQPTQAHTSSVFESTVFFC